MINKIIIGTANFGLNYGIGNNYKKIEINEIKKIIRFCKKKNITKFDTAIGYGNSEKILGRYSFESLKAQTKIPSIKKKNIKRYIYDLVLKSLKNLRIKRISCLFLHNENDLLSKNGDIIYSCLLELKKDKLINKIGVSFYTPDILEKVVKKYDIDIVQIPFNYLNNCFNKKKLLLKLSMKNIRIQARSIFLQGALLNENIQKKLKNKNLQKYFIKLNKHLMLNNISNLDYILSYVNNHKFINEYVIGIDSLKQLIEILNYKKNKFFLKPLIVHDKFKDPRKWILNNK
jgi:aryl-alcohol dehydrogenase-like predicted oxidoreductase